MQKFVMSVCALTMVFSLVSFAGATALQNESPVFEGQLLSVDATAKVITVKGAENKEMKFTYDEKTQIIGADAGVQGLAAKAGTPMKVTYRVEGGSNIATRIEVPKS